MPATVAFFGALDVSGKAEPSETAPIAVRIAAYAITLDGRRYGERFGVIVETK
jgi:hypothetical protein